MTVRTHGRRYGHRRPLGLDDEARRYGARVLAHIAAATGEGPGEGPATTPRLHCTACGRTYRYAGRVGDDGVCVNRRRCEAEQAAAASDDGSAVLLSIEPLGNVHGASYAAASRVEAILDEAVISGALTLEERRLVGLYVKPNPYASPAKPPTKAEVDQLLGIPGPDR